MFGYIVWSVTKCPTRVLCYPGRLRNWRWGLRMSLKERGSYLTRPINVLPLIIVFIEIAAPKCRFCTIKLITWRTFPCFMSSEDEASLSNCPRKYFFAAWLKACEVIQTLNYRSPNTAVNESLIMNNNHQDVRDDDDDGDKGPLCEATSSALVYQGRTLHSYCPHSPKNKYQIIIL